MGKPNNYYQYGTLERHHPQVQLQAKLNLFRDCQMKFSSVHQLQNHSKNFCIYSSYGNIQGLKQKQRLKDILDTVNLNQSNLKHYGNYSLEAFQNVISNNHNHKLAEKATRNREQELTNQLIKHQQTQRKVQYLNNHPQLTSHQQLQTSFARNLRQSQQNEFTSPPSYLPQDTVKKTKQSFAKQQSAIKNMTDAERWAYAEGKLKQLEDIKLAYIQNNGTDKKFINNLQNLYEFYQALKVGKTNNNSRLKTPIAKLNDFEQSTLEKSRARTSEIKPININIPNTDLKSLNNSRLRMNTNLHPSANQLIAHNPFQPQHQIPAQQFSQQYPQQYQVPYNPAQPIIIMPPYYPPYPDQSYLKHSQKQNNVNEMNLMSRLQDLLNQKQTKQKPTQQLVPFDQIAKVNKTNANNSQYLVQKFQNGLLPQERVLQALQREEFQELRMLSNLPPDLQRVKMDIIKETSCLRSQVEKQIQQQRILRMRHQLEMQEDHEEQLYQNQMWVDKQRKKEVSKKLIEEYEQQD